MTEQSYTTTVTVDRAPDGVVVPFEHGRADAAAGERDRRQQPGRPGPEDDDAAALRRV